MKKRVLLVEDEESPRETFKGLLIAEGFHVSDVGSLSEARDAIDRVTYHLALIDLMLDGRDTSNRDGFGVVEAILSLGEGTRCIILTGKGNEQITRDALTKVGAHFYLSKTEVVEQEWSISAGHLRDELAQCSVGDPLSWRDTKTSIFTDNEENFFFDLLYRNVGQIPYERVQSMLSKIVDGMQPLKKVVGIDRSFEWVESRECLCGLFWSKALGAAVEIVVGVDSAQVESSSDREIVMERRGAGLLGAAIQYAGYDRKRFEG